MQRQKLTGDALLTFVRQNQGGDRDAIAIDAGYFVMRHGRPSVQHSEFLQAVTSAQGLDIGPTISRKGRKGKPPTYKIKVSPKGIAPIGPCYTKQIGVDPGEFVVVTVEDGGIFLEPENRNQSQVVDELPFEAA